MNDKISLNENIGDGSTRLYSASKLLEIANDNKEFVKKMLNLCLKTLPESVNEINAYFQSKDYLKVSFVAHSLKATIDTMGIVSLKEDIRSIERIAKATDPEASLAPLINKLNNLTDQLVRQLEEDLK